MKQQYIGENIRIYRERAKLTQEQLADKVGVSWEMISRYERSKSSPLNQIDEISNALDIPKVQLLEKHIPESYISMVYRIPHFVNIPKSFRFLPSHTNHYYNCPEWIFKRDPNVFSIESNLINCDITNLDISGVLYISNNLKPVNNELVVLREDDRLVLRKFQDIHSNILGKVLAQEFRY